MDRRIQCVAQIMKKNYHNHGSLRKMAAQVDLSPSRFGHLFKQEMGQSFKAYLKNLRLQKASELLQRPRVRILEVAYRVGYADPSNFSRDFRKHFRETPRKHRHKI